MPIVMETELSDGLPELQILTLSWRLQPNSEDADDDDVPGIHVGRLEAWRWNEPYFDLDDVDKMLDELDQDGDLFAVGENFIEYRDKIETILEDQDWYDLAPQALLIGHRLEVPAQFRGHGIGLNLLRALQQFHAGFPCVFAINAVPLELSHKNPGFKDLQKRLIAYYKSEPALKLAEVASGRSDMLIAHWDGQKYAEPDYDLDLVGLIPK